MLCLDFALQFRPMASIWQRLLLFLAVLLALTTTSSAHGDGNLTLPCHPDQAATLLELKKSFSFNEATTNLSSWQEGTNCCRWEGVGCGGSSGRVTALNLNGRSFSSSGLDPVIFNLSSLRFLDLSMNDFSRYSMPAAGFERLTFLSHLNLSDSGFEGEIPIAIGKLENLISLDLSSHYGTTSDEGKMKITYFPNSLSVPNIEALVGNLSNLRALYLDLVKIHSTGEEWCKVLAKYVPRLQVLSFEQCDLSGPIHQSLSNLSSLSVINLQHNQGISAGPFPEFFTYFVNLSVLQLADINLNGWFPSTIFQSEKLRVLDLSRNMDLSGTLPNLSDASSLEILRLDETNFSYSKPSSRSNFNSLKELALDGKFISADFLSSVNLLSSLSHFSWISNLRNLRSLELFKCDFSNTKPSSISKLKSLRSLSIDTCNISSPILYAISNLKALHNLYLTSCRLNGSIPSTIGNLTNLRRLHINECGFLGPMPSSLGNLVNLRSLDIHGSEFSSPLPSTIGFLRNLKSLRMEDCKFVGSMPSTIGNLSNLESMVIFDCEFPGPIPYAVGQLKELTRLVLGGNNFSGVIPSSVGNLTCLLELDLSMNFLSGEIPTSIFILPELNSLDLFHNQLSGPLQEFNVVSSSLVYLELGMNKLTGQIPRSIFELMGLRRLNFVSNKFTGFVDLTLFWRLTKLSHLGLSNNKLSVMEGAGSNSFSTYPSGLAWLELVGCNITQFPSMLIHLNNLSYLDLSSNKLSGDIPNWIWGRFNDLSYLNLSHNMLTGFQLNSSVLPLSSPLYVLDLSSNDLQGQLPMPNKSAIYLDYAHNSFTSVLPNFTLYLNITSYLSMSNNSINGNIPHSVCKSRLEVLDLSYNNFSGPITSCLLEMVGLRMLNLRENHFEGTLSSSITSECTFQTIDLHGNKIEGLLPRALSNCNKLVVLDIGNHLIVDAFPSWLGELSNLSVLILRSNQFYGSIDDVDGNHQPWDYFSSLQIVDLASNNFSGSLSSEWFERLKSMMAKFNRTGKPLYPQISSHYAEFYKGSIEMAYKGSFVTFERILTTLTSIDLSDNRLEGTIPESVGQLVSLHVLNMSHNAFTGIIPNQFGGMADLESLDLSCNKLSGGIPQELADLTFLGMLNLSNNQLVGKVPQSHQFSTFESSSFEGNFGLCGPPLSIPCGVSPAPPSPVHMDGLSHVDVVLCLFVGLGFGVGFAIAILMTRGQISEWFVKSSRGTLNSGRRFPGAGTLSWK